MPGMGGYGPQEGGIGVDYGGADFMLATTEFFRIWDGTNTYFRANFRGDTTYILNTSLSTSVTTATTQTAYLFDIDSILNHANAVFNGIWIDLSGMTLTSYSALAALKISMPAKGWALRIDAATVTNTETIGVISEAYKSGTDTGKAVYLDIDNRLANAGGTNWLYGTYHSLTQNTAGAGIHNIAMTYYHTPTLTGEVGTNNKYAIYINTGYTAGLFSLSPMFFDSLDLEPATDINAIDITDSAAMVSASALNILFDVHTSGTIINLNTTTATIANAILKLASLNSSVILNNANARIEGLEIELSALTLTSYNFMYGAYIAMPAAYGAGTAAAIYATGNGNTLYVLGAYGINLEMGSNTAAIRITDAATMTSAAALQIVFDAHTSGNMIDFETNTATFTDSVNLMLLNNLCAHDGAAADTLYCLQTVWQGSLPQTSANATYRGVSNQYSGTIGSGGGEGGTHAGLYHKFNGTLNGTAINYSGLEISLDAGTYTSYANAAGVKVVLKDILTAKDYGIMVYNNPSHFYALYNNYGAETQDTRTDDNNTFIGYYAQKSITLTGAADKTNSNYLIQLATSNNRGAGGGNITDSSRFISMSAGVTVGTELISGNKVSMTLGGTVGAATLAAYYLDSNVTLNDAAAYHYGINLDLSGVTLTAYNTNYGIQITLPTIYGAGSDAAIYATGNDNIYGALYEAYGTYVKMRALTTTGLYVDLDSQDDTNNDRECLYMTKDTTLTGAVDKTITGNAINFNIVNNRGGGGGNITDSSAFISMAVTSTVGTELIQGNKVAMSLAGTVGNAILSGYYLDSNVTLNNAGAIHYGLNLDCGGVTLTSYAVNYGISITMPAVYGAGADAAIYATGGGNIFGALTGDGVYLRMREASSNAINLDISVANDTANDQVGIRAVHHMTETAAAAIDLSSAFISYSSDITAANAGGATATRTGAFIDMGITLTATNAADIATFTGGFARFAMALAGAGTRRIYDNMIELQMLGTNDQAQTLRGFLIDANVVLNNANAKYYGIEIDGAGMTYTLYSEAYGLWIHNGGGTGSILMDGKMHMGTVAPTAGGDVGMAADGHLVVFVGGAATNCATAADVAAIPNYWQRAGIIVSPATAGDTVSLGTGILSETGGKTLIDANRKFLPVEILGTNLSGTVGLLNTAMIILGNTSDCNVRLDTTDWKGLKWYTTNTASAKMYSQGANDFVIQDSTGKAELMVGNAKAGWGNADVWKAWHADDAAGLACISGYTFDGLDLSEYITGWQANKLYVTMEAAGYTNCVAGDKGKVVTDDGTAIGILCDYNNTTRVWTICAYNFTQPAGASAFAITTGTGAGTSVAAAPTRAPERQQNVKTITMPGLLCDGAGALTVYLTADGLSTGTALFAKRPAFHVQFASLEGGDVALAADFKSIAITGAQANDPVEIIVMGAVA